MGSMKGRARQMNELLTKERIEDVRNKLMFASGAVANVTAGQMLAAQRWLAEYETTILISALDTIDALRRPDK